jgi:uncharacterized protein (DUF1697 family)
MKLVAFLRALNASGHNVVTMDYVHTVFDAEGFANVEMFMASGNVVFDGDDEDLAGLERVIEEMLLDALGFEVPTFIRTDAEVRNIAKHKPFLPATLKTAVSMSVVLFKDALDAKATRAVMALKTSTDDFHVRGREVYWLSRRKQSESKISSAAFEAALGRPSALRGINLLKKMAMKYGPR